MADPLLPKRPPNPPRGPYEPEVPVEVREWIRPASASPDLFVNPRGISNCSNIDRAHLVHLSGRAIKILKALPRTGERGFLFTTRRAASALGQT
jgi:hypothetical protein